MRFVVLLLAGCSYSAHVPDMLDPCPRAVVEVVTAESECARLVSEWDTLFRFDSSGSCGGPPCLVLEPGQTAYVLERIRPAPPAEWRVEWGECGACPEL
jgi:hypothetical protein